MKRKSYFLSIFFLAFNFSILKAQSQTITWETSIPIVTSFCSPRAIDLNQDSVKDIILGAGLEGEGSPLGIFAFDGTDGSILWQRYTRDQIYGSPIFQDINGDSIPDVFISGRDAQFYALDGTNGTTIWEFWPDNKGASLDSGWYNFYLPQWLPDLNGDSINDIIVTNGGDPTLPPPEQNRPAGYLMVLSGMDGSIIQVDTMPDGEETYHSPLVVDFWQDGNLSILFGSGGETVAGKYWEISLSQFLSNGLSQAEILLSDSIEGYVAVPSIVDLNNNGIPDIVVPQMNQSVIALEGSSGQELWRYSEPLSDIYVSPTIGQFIGDPTPDIFAISAEGNWPFYQKTNKILIDGSNGQVVWSELGYKRQMINGIAIDWDDDGFDELIYPRNTDDSQCLATQFFLYDFNDQSITPFDTIRNGLINFSTPFVTDLDNDQSLEMIFVTHDNKTHWYQPDGFTIHRMELDTFRNEIAWGGYLGTNGNGIYPQNLMVSIEEWEEEVELTAYPNPVGDRLFFRSNAPIEDILIFDLLGRIVLKREDTNEVNLEELASGSYWYQVRIGSRVNGGRILKF